MHCVSRVPLATIGNQQQALQLSPLKALCLAEKENTVSTSGLGPAGAGRGGGCLRDWYQPLTARFPAATLPQWFPRAGQQDRAEDFQGARRAGE